MPEYIRLSGCVPYARKTRMGAQFHNRRKDLEKVRVFSCF